MDLYPTSLLLLGRRVASSGPEPYAHGDSQELFVVIRGEVTVEVDGEEFELHPGDTLEYRSSQLHRMWNRGDSMAEVLWIVSPVTVSTATI